MVTMKQPLEDQRGVDVGQIRQLLNMTVEERVLEMVRVANMIADVQRAAGTTGRRSGG